MSKKATIKEKIVDYIYTISQQPVNFKDLLSANSHFNEGVHVDSGKLGFRMNIWRAYLVYAGLCLAIFVPLFLITHKPLENVNFHISIVGSIVATAAVFMGFSFFKYWVRDAITHKLIKKAWALHFPYFAYEKYSQKVEQIFNESLKKEVSKRDLQKYIMEELLKEENQST